MRSISVVVPIYNEEGNVEKLHKEICEVCEREGYQYEIIFIDDGSQDGTGVVCRKLHPLKYIRLRRNYGQTAAMDAGIKAAQYGYIVTMDGDCQNNPADIPRMIAYLEDHGLDVVSGWRKNRKDAALKKFTSRAANVLRGVIIKDGIHDSGCSLKVYRKECFDGLSLYGEMHRFIPALLKTRGFALGEIVVDHRPRTRGVTKYNWKRTCKGFVDMISVWFWNKYSTRPLHIMGSFGLLCMALGIGCGIWSAVLFLLGYKMSDNVMMPLLTIFFIVVGLLLFVFGLMSDVLVKIYYGVHVESPYEMSEMIENKQESPAEMEQGGRRQGPAGEIGNGGGKSAWIKF